uniref:Uncharacterized protein n=1 Tax=Siphoviridae sp. ctxdc10 TaxID=2825740 RepID=A0A8S5TSF4_9CAUD|nr:MAG TPA: hypothetical protein [Siphoviridae sp. ctxdc10]
MIWLKHREDYVEVLMLLQTDGLSVLAIQICEPRQKRPQCS